MHIGKIKPGQKPFISPTGEVIYELIGVYTEPKNPGHSVARITLPPGKGAAKHYHPVSEESYYMISGSAQMILGEEQTTLQSGDTVVIPPNTAHKIWNTSNQDAVFLAICLPAWDEHCSVCIE